MSRSKMSWRIQLAVVLTAGSCMAMLILPSGAGTIRHDRLDSLYLDLAALPQFAALGRLLGEGDHNATLIADRWIVTSAHCVDNGSIPIENRSFVLGGQSYAIADITLHPDWVGITMDGTDIAVLELAQSVPDIQPAQRYAGTSELGATVVFVGFGSTGTGLTGEQTGTAGDKRAGENTFDALGSIFGIDDRIILSDFDEPLVPGTNIIGSLVPLDLEYQLATGDSGCGLFIQEEGQWYLVSVGNLVSDTGGDGIANNYGDVSGSTRIAPHNDWIDSVLCPSDANSDEVVDVQDLLDLLAGWGDCPAPCPSDANDDGVIDVLDLLQLLASWGACPG